QQEGCNALCHHLSPQGFPSMHCWCICILHAGVVHDRQREHPKLFKGRCMEGHQGPGPP
ncbi:hypothetical protein BG006_005779, partial [Podila minutissima]